MSAIVIPRSNGVDGVLSIICPLFLSVISKSCCPILALSNSEKSLSKGLSLLKSCWTAYLELGSSPSIKDPSIVLTPGLIIFVAALIIPDWSFNGFDADTLKSPTLLGTVKSSTVILSSSL